MSSKYERLSDFCYNCGRLTHCKKVCGEEKARSILNPNEDMYGGDWLCTKQGRELARNPGRVHIVFRRRIAYD